MTIGGGGGGAVPESGKSTWTLCQLKFGVECVHREDHNGVEEGWVHQKNNFLNGIWVCLK